MMAVLNIITDPAVDTVFKNYPPKVRKQMQNLRRLVLEVAKEETDIVEIQETLKWGEPSFLVKKGSTVRMDWKAKKPDQYAMYFKCTSKLVSSFIEVFGDTFTYEGHRALILP